MSKSKNNNTSFRFWVTLPFQAVLWILGFILWVGLRMICGALIALVGNPEPPIKGLLCAKNPEPSAFLPADNTWE